MASLGLVRINHSIKNKPCAYCPNPIESGDFYFSTFLKVHTKFWSNYYHINCFTKWAVERYGKPSKTKREFKDPNRKKLLRKRQYLLDKLLEETDEVRIAMFNERLRVVREELGTIDQSKQTRLTPERVRMIVEKQR